MPTRRPPPKKRPHRGGAPVKAPPIDPRRHHPLPDVTPNVDRFDEAIHAFQRRLPMSRGEWDRLQKEERKYAFMVSGVAHAELVLDVYDEIERSIRDGVDIETFKEVMTPKLEKEWGFEDAARVETIFRTNVASAYSAGRYEVYSAPAVKEARPYFRFDAIVDDRTDDECLDLNGTVLEQDDPFWSGNTPPLHFNCRCQITGLSKEEAEDEGIDDAPESDHASDGFGARPDEAGRDWEPDYGKYPDDIANELKVKIRGE